jgi:FixJ family two-component response regulator
MLHYALAMIRQGRGSLVAIVDDDDPMRSALQGLLKAVGLAWRAFASAEGFLNSGQQNQTSFLIADIRMSGISGFELQAKLNADRCRISPIVITTYRNEKMRMKASRADASILTDIPAMTNVTTIGSRAHRSETDRIDNRHAVPTR